jgi:hypothetical protein
MGARQSCVVYPGEQYLYKTRTGDVEVIREPRIVKYHSDEDCRALSREAATQLQYLVITKTSGEVIHRKGPCVEFWDGYSALVEGIRSVAVRNCEHLDHSEIMVTTNPNARLSIATTPWPETERRNARATVARVETLKMSNERSLLVLRTSFPRLTTVSCTSSGTELTRKTKPERFPAPCKPPADF